MAKAAQAKEATGKAASANGGANGGAATADPPSKKKSKKKRGRTVSPANERMRNLLTDDPEMGIVDVMSILLHDHLITEDERENAQRAFYKVRSRLRELNQSAPQAPAKAPTPKPAAAPVVTAPAVGPPAAKTATKPAAKLTPAQPPAGGAFDRGVGVAAAEAVRGSDADRFDRGATPAPVGAAGAGAGRTSEASRFERALLTKQTLNALAGLDPVNQARRLADLTDQVGTTTDLRECIDFITKFEAIGPTRAGERVHEPDRETVPVAAGAAGREPVPV